MNGNGAALSGGKMQEIDQGQLLASIAATLHDCILSLDARGEVVWASPIAAEVLGWPPDELAGRRLDVLFPAGSSDELRRAAFERLLAGDRVEPFVDGAVRRNGSTFSVQVTLGPVHGPDGEINGAIAVLRDVTIQQEEQRELALALEMSRAHFDQATTPQAILDLAGHLESVNPAWCELFGHGEGWFADCEILDLVHPVDTDQVTDKLRRLGLGELDSISFRGLFQDARGGELPLLLDASLLREPGGRPYAIAAAVADLDANEVSEGEQPASVADVLHRRAWDTAVVVDRDLTITYVSGALSRMLGYAKDDLLDHRTGEYVHPADIPVVSDQLRRVLAEPRRSDPATFRLRDGEGQWRWVESVATNCLDDPEVGGIVADLRDVTERVRTEEALRLSETLHRTMVESAQEGILATSPEGLVIFANETAAAVLGRRVDALYGEDPVRLLGLQLAPAEPGEALADAADEIEPEEVVHRRPDGDERILRVARRPLSTRDDRLGVLYSLTDVTDARHTERRLRTQALHDQLTDLPNRYLFLDRLETADARQQRTPGRGTAVLFLDVDRFKGVNDSWGHVAGDGVLREIAQRLLDAVRATDTVGRLGGDEFAVICEDTGPEESMVIARRILAAFEAPVTVDGRDHSVGVSVGVALAPPYSFDEVLRRADEAMYLAKQSGGHRVCVAGEELG